MAKIVVLATGGTIAGTAQQACETVAYQSAQIQIDELVGQVAGLDSVLQGDTLETEQIAQIDSKDMHFAIWQQLLQRCAFWLAQTDVRGVIITHGTDTLEETAYFLQQALAYCPDAHTWQDKALVLTCAMRPATARMPDGAQNFADACCLVRDPQAHGVLVVCAGVVHSAHHVQKIHPYRLDAFSSGDAGNIAWVEANCTRWLCYPPDWVQSAVSSNTQHQHWRILLHTAPEQFPWIEILHSHAGVDNRALNALVEAGVQGIIIVGTGNATFHDVFIPAIQTAHTHGVQLLLSSRCHASTVVRNINHTEAPDNALELAYGNASTPIALPPAKARIQLLLRLLLQ